MSDYLFKNKVDHLILLVGTNLLPNYVAAKLLLNEDGQLHLLHSADTRNIARRLEDELSLKANYDEIDEANASDIEDKIEKWIENISKNKSVGLNYTGGTKMMAVHAHRAFLAAMKKYHPNSSPVCSYLDARSYEMKFDSGGGVPVLKLVDVPLKTLLKLHGIKLTKKSAQTSTMLPKSAQILANLHACSDTAEKWRYWCNCELREKTRYRNKWIKSRTKLENITLNLPTDDVFAEFNKQLCEELGLPPNKNIPLKEIKPGKVFQMPHHILEWLDGVWLEHYVFNAISSIKDQAGINDMAMSLDTLQLKGEPNFEFDVGVMKGYQLFGISCSTTQNKGLAKSKLFEAYIRAKQLGGDEAWVGLVVPQSGLKQKLEKELPESIKGKVRVFDSTHLKNLSGKLQEWFEYA